MSVWSFLVAALLAMSGALLLYLGAPHQRLARRPLPPRGSAIGGSLALFAALMLMLRVTGPATAVYVLLTLLMVVWSLLPLLFAWLRHRRSSPP